MKRIGLAITVLLVTTYVACLGVAFWPMPSLPRRALTKAEDLFVKVEGHTLRYRSYPSQRDDQKPTLVMLHGFAGSLYAWRKVAPLVIDAANVVAVDIMPFGLSDKPTDFEYGYRAQARIISELVTALRIREPVPMGHSFGGTVAAYTALTDPRVRRLVLVDPGILATGIPSFVRYLFFPMGRVGARLFAQPNFRRRFVSKSFVRPELVTDDLMRELGLASHMEGYMAGTGANLSRYVDVEVDELLNGIKAQTLLVWGAHDRNNPPSNAALMAARLHSAEVRIVAGSGHYPHEERPEETAQAVREFLLRSGRSAFGKQPRADVSNSSARGVP